MKYDEFKKAVDRIIEDEDTLMIHVSPDFQCDQTLGFPTSLCVCWEQGKAWLAPNDFMMSDVPDDQAQDVLNACAEYGIRNCEDAEDFNNLLRGLGQDAMDNAWLPDDEEGMVLATAKAVPCSCSTALASVPSAPVMISVMKARFSNMAQMFRILGKRGRITIPFEIRQRVGFSYNDVLSFTEAPDGRTVIVKREKICDNCAAEKPQRKEAEDTITLFDFLNGLSDEQQKAAFAHLKLKWDRVQGSGLYGRS